MYDVRNGNRSQQLRRLISRRTALDNNIGTTIMHGGYLTISKQLLGHGRNLETLESDRDGVEWGVRVLKWAHRHLLIDVSTFGVISYQEDKW